MAERWLTFAEVEELLGVTADEVRELMEAHTLRGQIVDGVVKFGEASVRRLARGAGSGESHLKFLVDEDEERRIEGKAYDGESLAPPKPVEKRGEDEDILDPVELTEEQLRNSDLLGGNDIVEFGRQVAERSTAEEFRPAELADTNEDEEIIEPSSVELPDVEFGPLAERISEARREEPPEAPAPKEPPASPTLEFAEPKPERRSETPAETVLFVTEASAPSAPEPVPAKLAFVAEEAHPLACPVTEEAKAEAEKPPEVAPVEPLPPEPTTITFVEEPAKAETPEVPEVEPAVPVASAEPMAPEPSVIEFVEEPAKAEVPEAHEPEPAETYEVEPAVPVASMEAMEPEPPEPEPVETYEVEPAAPVVPVTENIERAVDEEVAEITPEEVAPAPVAELPEELVPPPAAEEAIPSPVEVSAQPPMPPEPPIVEEAVEFVPMEQYLAQMKTPEPQSAVEQPEAIPLAAEEAISKAEPPPAAAEMPPIVEVPVARETGIPEPPTAEEPAAEPLLEQPIAAKEVTPITPLAEGMEVPVEETPEVLVRPSAEAPRAVSEEKAQDTLEEIEAELSQQEAKESLPEAVPDGRISAPRSGEDKEAVPAVSETAGMSEEEAKPVTDKTKPTPDEQKKKKPEDIEVFDLGEQKAKPEEEFQILEEEPKEGAPTEAAPAKDKTLEEEMAELFGEEPKEAAGAAAAAAAAAPEVAKVEEDFDLSVFQKDKQEAVEPEPVEITEESLFDVGQEQSAPAEEQTISNEDIESQSRIKSITEERTPASVYLYTAAIVISFIAVGLTGMLLWHVFIMRTPTS